MNKLSNRSTRLINRIKYECNSVTTLIVYKQYTIGDVLTLISILIIFTLFWYVALVTGIKV